jgi:GNAT superfamily N-acetyltransferase
VSELAATLSVRPASPHDVAFVVEVCRSYVPVDALSAMLGRQDLLVAELDGRPVGYAALDRIGVVNPFLAAIRVLDPHRRRGVGRALLAELERRAVARGHAVLYSSCTADEAAPQAWHRRMGFQECGFVAGFNQGGVGEVFFRKRLDRQ